MRCEFHMYVLLQFVSPPFPTIFHLFFRYCHITTDHVLYGNRKYPEVSRVLFYDNMKMDVIGQYHVTMISVNNFTWLPWRLVSVPLPAVPRPRVRLGQGPQVALPGHPLLVHPLEMQHPLPALPPQGILCPSLHLQS